MSPKKAHVPNDFNESQTAGAERARMAEIAAQSPKIPEDGTSRTLSATADLVKKHAGFFGKEGMEDLDPTHALIQEMLTAEMAPELLHDEINKTRDIVVNKVLNLNWPPSPQKKPSQATTQKIDIQDVRSQDLKSLLNAHDLVTAHIPGKDDILPYVSETTLGYIQRLYRNLKTTKIAILLGPTGVAKTTMVKTLAAHLNLPLYQETGTAAKTFPELTQKIKIRKRKGQEEVVNIPSGLIQAALNGGIYLLDEFNNLEGDVQLAISQVVDDKTILLENGVRVPVHPHFYVVATANPSYAGTKKINDAVLRRAGGPIEIDTVPESEEIGVVCNLYKNRLANIAKARGISLAPRIPEEEIKKIVEIFRKLRAKVSALPQTREILSEDLVSPADHFSVRKMVDVLVMAQILNEPAINLLLKKVIGTLPPKIQEEMVTAFNPYPTIPFLEEKPSGNVSFANWQDWANDSLTDSTLFGESAPRKKEPKRDRLADLLKAKGGETVFVGVKDSEGTHFPLLKVAGAVNLPEFDFDEKTIQSSNETEGVELVKTVHIKKTAEDLERALIEKGERPIVRRLKKLLSFNYRGREGFVLFGFEANVKQAAYKSEGEKKAYIPNKYRLKSVSFLFVADDSDKAKMLINPETGESKVGLENIREPKRGEWISQGFIPVRAIKENSTDQEDGELASLVKRKIWQAMSHASEFQDESRAEEATSDLRSVADRIESAFEGTDVSEDATTENVGKYLQYLTRTMERTLEDIRGAHVSSQNILLKGPSGTGKTSLVKTYAIQARLPYIPVQFHEEATESSILKSVKLQNGQVVEVPYPLLLAYEHGWIAELRELNAADADEVAFLNTMLDANGQITCEGRTIQRHKNFLPIATLNPFDPIFEGTKPMNLALLNRFGMQVEVKYPDENEEANLLLAVLIKENPTLAEQEGRDTLKSVAALAVKAAKLVRDKMEEFKANDTLRGRLQKMKMATDFLMNVMRDAKDLPDLIGQIHTRLSLREEDKKIIEKAGIQSQLDSILVEFNQYI